MLFYKVKHVFSHISVSFFIKNEDIEEPIFDLRDRKRIFKRSYIDERTLDIDLYKRQSAVIR